MVSTLPIPSAPYGPLKRVDNLLISIHITRIPTGYTQAINRLTTGPPQVIHRIHTGGGAPLRSLARGGRGSALCTPPYRVAPPRFGFLTYLRLSIRLSIGSALKNTFLIYRGVIPRPPNILGKRPKNTLTFTPSRALYPVQGLNGGVKGVIVSALP